MITLSIVAAYTSIMMSTVSWIATAYAYRLNHPHVHRAWTWVPPLVYALLFGGGFTVYLWNVFTP